MHPSTFRLFSVLTFCLLLLVTLLLSSWGGQGGHRWQPSWGGHKWQPSWGGQYWQPRMGGQGSKNNDSRLLATALPSTDASLNRTGELLAGQPQSLSPTVHCYNSHQAFRQSLRGRYWVLYNYIMAEKHFQCNETITYTTHGDFTYLDNLVPLLTRWQGPLSIALYAPGSDFQSTIDTILYYRDCSNSSLVRQFVTFHIYFDFSLTPEKVPSWQSLLSWRTSCSPPAAVLETFRKVEKLDYPVNVARNIARQTVNTHFVFPSDVELYPSPGTIPAFLDMIRRQGQVLTQPGPMVFVNNIFEIKAGHSLPHNKTSLLQLLKKNIVIPFHQNVCPDCHAIPQAKTWMTSPEREGMEVMGTGSRVRPFHRWEPIYIGTNQEPLYDERLSWEGRSDKFVQGYKLCLLDYKFHILDNAFLIHRPGIKTANINTEATNKSKVYAQNVFIGQKIHPQIKKIYGSRDGCQLV